MSLKAGLLWKQKFILTYIYLLDIIKLLNNTIFYLYWDYFNTTIRKTNNLRTILLGQISGMISLS